MAGLGDDQAARIDVAVGNDAEGVPLITVSGELDISNAETFRKAVNSASARHPRRLILQLSGLRFIDSAGIAVLLTAVSNVDELCLRSPSPAVRRILEVTGLLGVMTIEA